jgi:hypothetical protein
MQVHFGKPDRRKAHRGRALLVLRWVVIGANEGAFWQTRQTQSAPPARAPSAAICMNEGAF